MRTYEELKEELREIAKLLTEFPDSVRPQVYELLIAEFTGVAAVKQAIKHNGVEGTSTAQNRSTKTGKEKPATSRKGSLKESYGVDRNLNLRGGKNSVSFRDFHNEKGP